MTRNPICFIIRERYICIVPTPPTVPAPEIVGAGEALPPASKDQDAGLRVLHVHLHGAIAAAVRLQPQHWRPPLFHHSGEGAREAEAGPNAAAQLDKELQRRC